MSERTKRKAATNVSYNENGDSSSKPRAPAVKKPKTEKLPKFEEFEKGVKPLKVTVTTSDGKELFKGTAGPASFSQKSFGWQVEGKFTTNITVDGKTQEVTSDWTLSAPIVGKLVPEGKANGDAK